MRERIRAAICNPNCGAHDALIERTVKIMSFSEDARKAEAIAAAKRIADRVEVLLEEDLRINPIYGSVAEEATLTASRIMSLVKWKIRYAAYEEIMYELSKPGAEATDRTGTCDREDS